MNTKYAHRHARSGFEVMVMAEHAAKHGWHLVTAFTDPETVSWPEPRVSVIFRSEDGADDIDRIDEYPREGC